MTIQEALTDFLIEQQIRGNTPKTIQYYSLSVGLYARFAGSDTPLQEITLNSLRAYYLHLAERNISSTTIHPGFAFFPDLVLSAGIYLGQPLGEVPASKGTTQGH